jgi:glucokinase
MNDYAIGIDLGGTNVKAVAVTPAGHILRHDSFGTCDDPAMRWASAIKLHIEQLESELGRAAAVGIASPGLAARDEKSIAWMQGRLAAVQGFSWTDYLKRESTVPVLNDAHAALLGEVWCGAAAGKRDVVVLTLGTGVGGAILCDGQLLKGHLGRAGHLGHMSLDPSGGRDIVNTPGSLEDAIGECTLQRRSGGRFSSTRQLVEAFVKGDSHAQQVWLASVKALAAGIASIINMVDPELVILGGGIAKAGDSLSAPLKTYLDEFEWRPTGSAVQIVPAKLAQTAGALGAAKNAWEKHRR